MGCMYDKTSYGRHEAREKLLKAAHDVIGQRVDERAEDPGWDAELCDERLLISARAYVEAHADEPQPPGG